MKHEYEKEEQFDLVYDADSHEQSTSMQSKQSNANLAALPENQKNFKLKRAQRSLLQLNPICPQRRGSQSCIEQISVIPEEPQIENSHIYTVYYYDEQNDHLNEIQVRARKEITIAEFIKLAIEEFDVQNHYFHSPFGIEENYTIELYVPKKKNKKPNEDFPAFSENTQLFKTNITSFAIKIQQKEKIKIVNQSNESPKIQKPFWEKFLICCNFDI